MFDTFDEIIRGYTEFRKKYAAGDNPLMKKLADGQRPELMVVACCDSRVDPALLLQCNPGDIFVVRNVANIIPPYENDEAHHGTSAALEFGICYLNIKHLIVLGHSQCAGIHALLNREQLPQDDFISNWTDVIKLKEHQSTNQDACAKDALVQSYQNCLTFPWLQSKIQENSLFIHLWYFEIETGIIYCYHHDKKKFLPLDE